MISRRKFVQSAMVAGAGGILAPAWARNPRGSPGVIGGGAIHKFTPGHYIQSGSNLGGITANQTEMNAIVAHTPKTVIGYAGLYRLNQFENLTLGTYDFSAIATDFNYWQSVASAPNNRFAIGVACYANTNVTTSTLATADPHSHGTPQYILNDPGTYGAGPPGNNGNGGYGLSSYDGVSTWAFQNMALWKSTVMDRHIAFWTALAASTVLPPYLGTQYTIDTHPLIEFIFDYGPTDLAMSGSPANPTDYSSTAWQAQWLRRMAPMSAAFPHTIVGLMLGFGANGPGGSQPPSDQGLLLDALDTNKIALTCTDCFAGSFNATPRATYAQQQFIGNTYPGGVLTTGGRTDYRGRIPSLPSVQGYDYANLLKTGGGGVNQIQTVVDIANVAVTNFAATHIFWQAISNTSPATPGNLNTFILPGIDASPSTVTTRPSNLS